MGKQAFESGCSNRRRGPPGPMGRDGPIGPTGQRGPQGLAGPTNCCGIEEVYMTVQNPAPTTVLGPNLFQPLSIWIHYYASGVATPATPAAERAALLFDGTTVTVQEGGCYEISLSINADFEVDQRAIGQTEQPAVGPRITRPGEPPEPNLTQISGAGIDDPFVPEASQALKFTGSNTSMFARLPAGSRIDAVLYTGALDTPARLDWEGSTLTVIRRGARSIL